MVNDIRIGNYFNVPREEQSPFYVYNIDVKANKIESEPPLLMDNSTPPHPLMRYMVGHPLTWEFKDLKGISFDSKILNNVECFGYDIKVEHLENSIVLNIGTSIIINFKNDNSIVFEDKMVKMNLNINYFHELQNWLEDNYKIILTLKNG